MCFHFFLDNSVSVTVRFWTNITSALGCISQLFLAYVPNLFVAWVNWANVLVGLSAIMGTAPADIFSPCSCAGRTVCSAWGACRSATSAECGEDIVYDSTSNSYRKTAILFFFKMLIGKGNPFFFFLTHILKFNVKSVYSTVIWVPN